MIEVIPGILEQDFPSIVKKIRMVEGFVNWIQIDLLDGTLFGNSCFHDPSPFVSLQTTSNLELHMMVVNPENVLDSWAKVGFRRFIAHIEGISDAEKFITKVRSLKKEVGLALDIGTDVSLIEPYIPNIDLVLLMAINTGKSGQEFQDKVVTKIQRVKTKFPDIPVEVDGGITLETAKRVVMAGTNRIVSNSYIFSSQHVLQTIRKLQQIV